MNGLDQRTDTGGTTSVAGPASTAAVGKQSLVDTARTGAPTAAGPSAESTQAGATAAPDVDVGAPNVEGGGTTGGPLTKDKAKQILQDAFGKYKTITEGTVEVLEQAAFQAAYDKIYGKTQYSWDKWVKPIHGNLNGFAYNGVNYINKAMANTGTVPHEMLHNNAASDWRPFVGSQFDEGATDVLKQFALKKAGLSSPNSYPDQISCVRAFLDSGVSEDQLFTAYLKSGAATIVGDHVDKTCAGSWADVKAAMEAKDWAKAKVKLAKKK
ncbi:MAG TPA: hypothetical protein VF516_11630 [Kofleriaceae bacterium]